MNLRSIAAVVILSAASYAASAQTAKPASLPADNVRIHNGVKSGELTPAERARLNAQKRNIRKERKDYKADGVVTAGERQDLRKDKKKLSRNIYRQKHDAQTTTP